VSGALKRAPLGVTAFADAIAQRPTLAEPAIRRQLRKNSEALAAAGLPSPLEESWRMTNLRPVVEAGLTPAAGAPTAAPSADAVPTPDGARRFVFVDGVLDPSLSDTPLDSKDVFVGSIALAARDHPERLAEAFGQRASAEDVIAGVNAAFHLDGLFVWLAAGSSLDEPIAIVNYVTAGVSAHPRHAFVLGANAHATLFERFIGAPAAACLTNSVGEASIADGAKLVRVVEQSMPSDAFALNQFWASVGKDAVFDNFALNVGGGVARDDLRVSLDAPGAHVALNGVFLADARRHLDTATIIRHAREHTTSDEKYRGVLSDKSVGVFQGRIEVRPDAQKIEGHQMTRGLLLSERAKAHFKPELEIFADDVKCSHGSTIGQLDETALFYLRSRGLPLTAARRLLIDAFVEEGLDDVAHAPFRAWIGESASQWVRQ